VSIRTCGEGCGGPLGLLTDHESTSVGATLEASAGSIATPRLEEAAGCWTAAEEIIPACRVAAWQGLRSSERTNSSVTASMGSHDRPRRWPPQVAPRRALRDRQKASGPPRPSPPSGSTTRSSPSSLRCDQRRTGCSKAPSSKRVSIIARLDKDRQRRAGATRRHRRRVRQDPTMVGAKTSRSSLNTVK